MLYVILGTHLAYLPWLGRYNKTNSGIMLENTSLISRIYE